MFKIKVKGKETASSSSKSITKTATVTKLKEKKLYCLPGQKYDIPEEVSNITIVCFVLFLVKPPTYWKMTPLIFFFFRETHWGSFMDHWWSRFLPVRWQNFGWLPADIIFSAIVVLPCMLYENLTSLFEVTLPLSPWSEKLCTVVI